MQLTSKGCPLTTIFLFTLIFTLSPSNLLGQEQEKEYKDFKITVQKTKEGVKLRSSKGSAWLTLSFTLATDETQAIDEYGMTRVGRVYNKKNPELADFLFTLTKTEEGILLKGITGTAWTELRFPLQGGQKQRFNAYGMTKLN